MFIVIIMHRGKGRFIDLIVNSEYSDLNKV